jgi:hypothetical protein
MTSRTDYIKHLVATAIGIGALASFANAKAYLRKTDGTKIDIDDLSTGGLTHPQVMARGLGG